MTGNQIFEQLNNNSSDWRWDGDNQPSIYFVTAILEKLPLKWVVVGECDTLQVYCTRALTIAEHFMLLMLNADKVACDGDGQLYTLKWN